MSAPFRPGWEPAHRITGDCSPVLCEVLGCRLFRELCGSLRELRGFRFRFTLGLPFGIPVGAHLVGSVAYRHEYGCHSLPFALSIKPHGVILAVEGKDYSLRGAAGFDKAGIRFCNLRKVTGIDRDAKLGVFPL